MGTFSRSGSATNGTADDTAAFGTGHAAFGNGGGNGKQHATVGAWARGGGGHHRGIRQLRARRRCRPPSPPLPSAKCRMPRAAVAVLRPRRCRPPSPPLPSAKCRMPHAAVAVLRSRRCQVPDAECHVPPLPFAVPAVAVRRAPSVDNARGLRIYSITRVAGVSGVQERRRLVQAAVFCCARPWAARCGELPAAGHDGWGTPARSLITPAATRAGGTLQHV